MAGETDPMDPNNTFQVLIAVSRVEGQMSALVQMVTNQSDTLNKMSAEHYRFKDQITGDVAGVRDRITAIEATGKAKPPWWVVVGTLTPLVALLLILGKPFYS